MDDQALRFYFTPFNASLRGSRNGPIFDTFSFQKSCPNLLCLNLNLTPTQISLYKKLCLRKFETSNWIKKYQRLIELFQSRIVDRMHSGNTIVKAFGGSFIELSISNQKDQKIQLNAEAFYVFDVIQLLSASNYLTYEKNIYVAVPTHFNDMKRKQILTAFEICGIPNNRIHLVDMGLSLASSVMSADPSLVVKTNNHLRLIIVCDDNGIELHLIKYNKENLSIETEKCCGSFGFCLQEFAYDCTRLVFFHLPWGSFIPDNKAVYEELLSVFSKTDSLVFPIKLACCGDFLIQEEHLNNVFVNYESRVSKFLTKLDMDVTKLNDIVVCGSGFLTSLVKKVISKEFKELKKTPVVHIEGNRIPQLVLSGLPCSNTNIKLIPKVYTPLYFKRNNDITLLINLQVSNIPTKLNLQTSVAEYNIFVKFFRKQIEIASTSFFSNTSFEVMVNTNGLLIINRLGSDTKLFEVCTCSEAQKDQVLQLVEKFSVLSKSISSIPSNKITHLLMEDGSKVDPNKLEPGYLPATITLQYDSGSVKLSKLNYYSRSQKWVYLYESENSKPLLSLVLAEISIFFSRYIITNCIQLETFDFKSKFNQIFLGDDQTVTNIDVNNSKIFCRVDGHEFQINPLGSSLIA